MMHTVQGCYVWLEVEGTRWGMHHLVSLSLFGFVVLCLLALFTTCR